MDPTIKDHKGVYYPREDSYLLADVVRANAKGDMLDLGTGSGIQGITAAKAGCKVTFADIDPGALDAARENAKANGVSGEFVQSDLFSNISDRFDTIAFNPPYLPSGVKKEIALDGGKSGREIIERFLKEYKNHLKPHGRAFILESSLSLYHKEVELGARIVARGHYFFEDLVVLELL